MSGDDFDVRRIVRGLARIEPVTASVDDPLGLGTRPRKPSRAVEPPLYFPHGAQACSGWVTAAAQPIMGLEERFWLAAYRQLFTSPTLLHRMPSPEAHEWPPADLEIDPALTYHHVAVATLVQPSDPRDLDVPDVAAAPLAGCGRLVIVTNESPHPVEAFADVTWSDTTDAFASRLYALWKASGQPHRSGLRRVVVVSSSCAAFTDEEVAAVTSAATMYGFTVELVPASRAGAARPKIKSQAPHHLLVDDRCVPQVRLLSEDYEEVVGLGRRTVYQVDSDEVAAMLRGLRNVAGLGAGLVSVHQRPPAKQAARLDRTGRAWLHPRRGMFVEESEGIVLAIDQDRHAESTYKQYSVGARGLSWVADLDENRQPMINKHKSEKDKFISWSKLSAR